MDSFERYHPERPEGDQGEGNGLLDTCELDKVGQTLFRFLIGIYQTPRGRESVVLDEWLNRLSLGNEDSTACLREQRKGEEM
jgi:hypothetical protein